MKNWKTTAVGVSQLVLGLISFTLFAIGKIDYIALGGSLGSIGVIGSIIGNMFAADGKISTLAKNKDIGTPGNPGHEEK